MTGTRYWIVSLLAMALLVVLGIAWGGGGGWGWFLVWIVISVGGMFFRNEHEKARAIKDAEDHPPSDQVEEHGK